jgi:hypothetical protein
MARITCAISGIRFDCSFMDSISMGHDIGYYHPIFALPRKRLYSIYTAHSKGELTSTDSYLLFLSLLHSSEKVTWEHPAICKPTEQRTKQIVHNNIAQLIRVLEKTDVIKHPSFKQPHFKLTLDTAHLDQIPNWIKAWEKNIEFFNSSRVAIRQQQSLQEVENRLSLLINSGEKPEKYAYIIATWADEAANFPAEHRDIWMQTIRSCFNITKMFNTPLPLLKEIKDYCECNIEAGSIHFHALCEVLKEGISRHVDYLGGSSLALGYTLLPTLGSGSALEDRKKEAENKAEIALLVASAPTEVPDPSDYPKSLDYLKAKIAYRLSLTAIKKAKLEAIAVENRKAMELITPAPETNNPEDFL